MPDNYRELVGAIHIHSNFSDGTLPIPEIANIANEVGLDFIMSSDHMTLEPLHQGLEGFYGRTAVLIGYEINDPDDKNHYLAFGLDEVIKPGLPAKEYVREVHEKNGLGIIAHPDQVRNALATYPSYHWTEWGVDCYDGIEIWNHMSQWMESLSHWNAIKQLFMPRRALRGPTDRILRRWDEINVRKKVVGVGSIDVHAYPYRIGPLRITIFPYKVQFQAIRTHILVPEPVPDDFGAFKKLVYDSLRSCRVFISNYRWGDARGFEFTAENSDGVANMGDELNWDKNTVLNVSLPKVAEIRLICNNQAMFEGIGDKFNIKIKKTGLFRVEVFVNGKGWIYSNHIRIKQKEGETKLR
jgi:hypothetical protein